MIKVGKDKNRPKDSIGGFKTTDGEMTNKAILVRLAILMKVMTLDNTLAYIVSGMVKYQQVRFLG